MITAPTYATITIQDCEQLVIAWHALEEAKTDPARVAHALCLASDLLASITVGVGHE